MMKWSTSLRMMLCTVLASSMIAVGLGSSGGAVAEAASDHYKFDFGAGAVENGYTGVFATTAYTGTRGYGFNTPASMRNVTASGSGIASDAVQFLKFGTKSDNTFNVDLPNGLYEVKVTWQHRQSQCSGRRGIPDHEYDR